MAVGYGWPDYSAQTPNEEILRRLLALNRADEGGYVATASLHGIVTQADSIDELHAQFRDARRAQERVTI